MNKITMMAVLITIALITLSVTGCARRAVMIRPVIDRAQAPEGRNYHADLSHCNRIADRALGIRSNTARKTFLGGALGAATGAAIGAIFGAPAAGAALGAATGGMAGVYKGAVGGNIHKREIVARCMRSYGYTVLSY